MTRKPFFTKSPESFSTLLTISFFVCRLPVLFEWFGFGSQKGMAPVTAWTGLSALSPLFVLSVALYYIAVWGKPYRRLGLGVLSHVLLAVSYIMAYHKLLPFATLINRDVNLPPLNSATVQPGFRIAVATGVLHLILFMALEMTWCKYSVADSIVETPSLGTDE